jgi:hypothetical protein
MSNSSPVSQRLARSLAIAAGGLLMLGTAAAQSQARPSVPDPLNAEARVPAVIHRSAIASHRSAADQPVGSWREANETVNRIGGWRTYAKERAVDANSTAPTTPSSHEGHAGHDMGKKR